MSPVSESFAYFKQSCSSVSAARRSPFSSSICAKRRGRDGGWGSTSNLLASSALDSASLTLSRLKSATALTKYANLLLSRLNETARLLSSREAFHLSFCASISARQIWAGQ